VETVLLLLLLLPLGGSVINAAVGRLLPRRVAEVIACAAVLGALIMAAVALTLAGKQTYDLTFFPWINVGDFSAAMNVHYDPLAAIMVLMVTLVSSLIHVYSVAFMRHDPDYVRYFSYLNLFVFAMLVITVADNLIFVYLGWEGVGFCSYALIGFWYADEANAAAGRKAFVVTRIGDIAFGVALGLFFVLFHSFSLTYIDSHAGFLTTTQATILSLLLLWAAAVAGHLYLSGFFLQDPLVHCPGRRFPDAALYLPGLFSHVHGPTRRAHRRRSAASPRTYGLDFMAPGHPDVVRRPA
jgi:NADH-quinone oxidoreductase subunit L